MQQINTQEIIQAADECVMCGLCLPHCPTYEFAKLESESPRGRIALVRGLCEQHLQPNRNIHKHLNQCLTCLSCESICPANVNYEKIIDAGRALTKNQQSLNKKLQQSILLFILGNLYARKLFNLLIRNFHFLGIASLLKKSRLLDLLPYKNKLELKTSSAQNKGPQVILLNSCAGDLINDETLVATTHLLTKLGCNVTHQEKINCCGALHQHCGNIKTATMLKNKFINTFQNKNTEYIAPLTTGCGAYIMHYADKLNGKFIDLSELVLKQLEQKRISFEPMRKKVFLHIPCSQKKVTNDNNLTDRLLNYIPEIEIIHFQDENTCCGAGGLNTLIYDDLANQLINNKVNQIKKDDAAYLVSSNIGCALHFQARLRQEDIPVQVCHPVTLLAQQVL